MKKRICGAAILMMVLLSSLTVFAGDVTVINWGTTSSNTVTANTSGAAPASTVNTSKPYLALGADLSQEQLATVLSMMGLNGQDLNAYNIVYVTNAEEHAGLDQYVSPSIIGTKSLSSVLVQQAEEGHGVQVTTKNINYCTTGMYRNALLTAGVENADIMVVGPTPISGTAALIGALKAYEDMSGKKVTDASLDTALNELVTTGEISDALGNPEEVENLIAFIKAEIAGKDLNTREEIDAAVREAITKYGATLTEEEITKIVDLMVKIKDLGLDYNTLLDQASDLYKKFGDKLTVEDLENLGNASKGEIVKQAVGQFFTNVFDSIGDFFTNLF